MAEPNDFDKRDKPHIAIDAWRESVGYEFPQRAQQRKPLRDDYVAHGRALLEQLAAALPPPPAPDADTRTRLNGLQPGTLIAVGTLAPDENARTKAVKMPTGFDFTAQDIVVLRSERRDDRTEGAIVFVPDTSQAYLRSRVAGYGNANLGNAKRPDVDRFEVVETIAATTAASLFAVEIDPNGPAIWWELWARQSVADGVAVAARAREFDVHGERLYFPDTTVVLVHARPADLLLFAQQTPGAIAEIRPATGTICPFLERGDTVVGQADFVADLTGRVSAPSAEAPLVGLLDTGVAGEHPLIAPGLAGAYAYDDAWGVDDHIGGGGHGTGMSSLILYGDLSFSMQDNRAVDLTHGVVSMKLLPPGGMPPNAPQHYGLITQGAIAQVEIAHGVAVRTFCMAVTTDEFAPERPSAWSGALDQIAAGSSVGDAGDPSLPAHDRPKRLLVVSAGNVEGGMRDFVTAHHPIEDPAQSWNALTVGGYTTLDRLAAEDGNKTAVAPANTVSPFSRSSDMLPDDLTPIKPEVLFEAGNMLADAADFCGWSPSVSLLSAGNDVAVEPLTPIWATSAATGIAGNFLGQLEATLPGLWPETYRALTVQSANWPAPIKTALVGRGAHWSSGRAVATKAAKQKLLRRVGYGVPDVSRTTASAMNDLTLTAQAELQPFALSQNGGSAVYNDMHFYDLPWPREALQQLENTIVTMKVTLSYFIEPNLTGRAATRPDTYRSFGLRFRIKKRGETTEQFRARVNAAQEHDGDAADGEADYWLLGPNAISAGSLHCDLWRGHAVDLALHDAIAIVPVGGWWKSHLGQRRVTDRCRYSLTVTISAPGQEIDLHSEVMALVEAKAAEIEV
ncbi:MAG: S8 family peptidase [Candidatus Brevundimonas colombiensis]|uniref:S8 family peptidase n=1 Tax=Candidatus Brevundimonas colombiensis TaxID=3121376 RepID=A0AAJ6BMV0_9CAUL|nr:S8 family peptidase [Brevundimonas sp.]WEK41449.1 MAG: S8 family peptidase [Brevundimonas sp.]